MSRIIREILLLITESLLLQIDVQAHAGADYNKDTKFSGNDRN